jgi:Tfp pilus assembly protein PilV
MKLTAPLSSQRGATLVESIVAIALAGIIITAIVGLVTSAVATSTLSKSRTTATRYSEEGVEVARKNRDRTPWQSFWNTYGPSVCRSAAPCHIDSSLNIVSGAGLSISPFARTVVITDVSAQTCGAGSGNYQGQQSNSCVDRLKVTVSVTWIDKGRNQEVKLVSYLTTWNR